MGRKESFAFIQNLKILSPAWKKLEAGQLVDHACHNFTEDLPAGLSLFAAALCNAWLSVLMAPFPSF